MADLLNKLKEKKAAAEAAIAAKKAAIAAERAAEVEREAALFPSLLDEYFVQQAILQAQKVLEGYCNEVARLLAEQSKEGQQKSELLKLVNELKKLGLGNDPDVVAALDEIAAISSRMNKRKAAIGKAYALAGRALKELRALGGEIPPSCKQTVEALDKRAAAKAAEKAKAAAAQAAAAKKAAKEKERREILDKVNSEAKDFGVNLGEILWKAIK